MADYRDLLRRAIDALPENNGNARRQVYDKARAALRKQLDAIQPELPSREKTHHRLQLEECIREVEQEATERMLSGLSRLDPDAFGAPPPESPPSPQPAVPEPAPAPRAESPLAKPAAMATFVPPAKPPVVPKPAPLSTRDARSEDRMPESALASATAYGLKPAEGVKPAVVSSARSEALADKPAAEPIKEMAKPLVVAKPANAPPATPISGHVHTAVVAPQTPPVGKLGTSALAVEAAVDRLSARQATEQAPPNVERAAEAATARPEPAPPRFSARVSAFVPKIGTGQKDKTEPTVPAMSAEREVDLDGEGEPAVSDPQLQIDHAIEILDREASGKGVLSHPTVETVDPAEADIGFARAEADDEGGGSPALMIFLVLVLLLLAGAGGASYWAWREGYLDLSSLFGSGDTMAASDATTAPVAATPPATPAAEAVRNIANGTETDEASRPGNTAAMPNVVETPETGLEQGGGNTLPDAALALAPTGTTPAPTPTATMDGTATPDGTATAPDTGNAAASDSDSTADAAASVAEPSATDDKIDQRLPVAEDAAAATDVTEEVAAVSPELASQGSQSLLLEASDQANAGAVPYSGTVDWTRGVDELGVPTLEGRADIPARNMSVNLLVKKNSDASLPASHIIEIDFEVSDSFIGGGISRIAGILMKNEELVQGVQLVGASARIVGNRFLFALSAAPEDVVTNNALLKSRKWMDLAIIYSTGKQAILTLEKDDAAATLFEGVIAAWTPDVPAGDPETSGG
ncbi:MAG: hypothetical protein KKH72_13410 [Alphaproteobacteria bacterium]|nr:hypothetical protein [Alphaproteobacteria bacterium]